MQLRPYQRQALDFILERRRVIYADAPGTGKTPTSCAVAEALGGRVLVVAPLPVLGHWRDELARWHPTAQVFVGHGTAAQRRKARQAFASAAGARVLIINYETLRSDIDELVTIGFDTLICDEAHRLKNRKAKTFKAAEKLARRVDDVLLVTGTPILNAAEELWALLHLLDPKGYPSFWRWADEYCDVEQTTFWGRSSQPVNLVHGLKPGAAAKLRDTLANVLIQRPIEWLLPDMPEVEHVLLPVTLSPAERKLYDQLEKHYWTQQDGEVVIAPNEVSKLTRLRQLASDWGGLWSDQDQAGTKVKATIELIEDLAPEQIVVLTAYKNTAEQIAAAIPDCAVYTGDTDAQGRIEALDFFGNGIVRVLVGTLGAISEGVDGLQVARHIVLVDRDWTPARNEQAIARIRRSGQEASSVVAYHVFAQGTVDEMVARTLTEKQQVIDSLLGQES